LNVTVHQSDTYNDDKVCGDEFANYSRDGNSLKVGIEMSDVTQDSDEEELMRRSFGGNETDTGITLFNL
jgi:hypothetical protein